MMKKYYVRHKTFLHVLITLIFVICVALYVSRIISSVTALAYYQKFLGVRSFTQSQLQEGNASYRSVQALEKAIRYDKNNAKYVYELGQYLMIYRDSSSFPENPEETDLVKAEHLLQQAVMLDPGSPWSYYELARLEFSRGGECRSIAEDLSPDNWTDCPPGKYFFAALQNAPNSPFLRTSIGGWLYSYNPEAAVRLVHSMLSSSDAPVREILDSLWEQIPDDTVIRSFIPDIPEVIIEYARLLYDQQLDAASDAEMERITAQLPETSCESFPFFQRTNPNQHEHELGYDDGTGEWRIFLGVKPTRVKKQICLPKHLEEYQVAALRIYAKSTPIKDYLVEIGIDDSILTLEGHLIPEKPVWYEIPVDMAMLRGKTIVNIYIRVSNVSDRESYLQIWGDQDTPTRYSSLNFYETDDLSLWGGEQTGEYMIRLVLKK